MTWIPRNYTVKEKCKMKWHRLLAGLKSNPFTFSDYPIAAYRKSDLYIVEILGTYIQGVSTESMENARTECRNLFDKSEHPTPGVDTRMVMPDTEDDFLLPG